MIRHVFGFLCLLLAVFLPAVLAVAQQPKKVPLIGYLSSGTAASESTRSEAIRLALREIGYTEGQNIAIEFRYGHGNLDQAAERASELARLNIDMIVIAGGRRGCGQDRMQQERFPS